MEQRLPRVAIDHSSFADELRILHEVTGKLLECHALYARYHDRMERHRSHEMDYFLRKIYQDIQDTPTHPMPYQHLSMLGEELRRGMRWLYIMIDTIEHPSAGVVYVRPHLGETFARMRTEPEIPVIKHKKKGEHNA